MSKLSEIKNEIKSKADPKRAKASLWFFKTAPGQYGYGDKFWGLNSPTQKMIAKEFRDLDFADLDKLLASSYHEERQIALLILVLQYAKADVKMQKQIYDFYLKHTTSINNWDLVDITAPKIVGAYLLDKSRKVLYKLAHSKDLWEKRIAIISTFWFIKEKDYADSLAIAKILLHDKHDLIHKAVGWTLREVGNKSPEAERIFLSENYKQMPRTMLRYAIEKFPEKERQKYLKGTL